MNFARRTIWQHTTQFTLSNARPSRRSLGLLKAPTANNRIGKHPIPGTRRDIWTDHDIPPQSSSQHVLHPHNDHAQSRTHQPDGSEALPSNEEPLHSYEKGGFHPVEIGHTFKAGRYEIIRKLGWGRYSTVWLALDKKQGCHVALKVLSSNASNTASRYGLPELEVMTRVMCTDPTHLGYDNIVAMIDHFEHTGANGDHTCLVMEAMADSMQGLEARNVDLKVPLKLVKKMTRQVLMALDYLHDHCRIVHSDIKPDNIMITSSTIEPAIREILRSDKASRPPYTVDTPYSNIPKVVITPSQPLTQLLSKLYDDDPDGSRMTFKLGDLGVSNFVDNPFMEQIQPPALRCPEVIIGAPWDTKADIWNFGCIIYEELTGRWLFNPNACNDPQLSSTEHLSQITELLGCLPEDLLVSGKHTSQFFDDSHRLKHYRGLSPVTLEALLLHWSDLSSDEAASTAEFLSAMLKVRPNERLTAAETLQHKWLDDIPSS